MKLFNGDKFGNRYLSILFRVIFIIFSNNGGN